MTALAAFILVIALIAPVWGAPGVSSEAKTQGREPQPRPYKSSGPLQYGEHPAQSLVINYYPGGPPRPAVVLITGWTAGAFGRAQETPPLYENLGLAFVRITHRSVNEFRHPAQLNDVTVGLKYLKEHGTDWNINPNRLALTGKSAGAHLAMLLAFHPDSPDVAAVVERSAPTDFDPDFMRSINPEMVKLPIFEKLFGDAAKDWNSDAMKAKIKEFSPVTYMSPDDPPTLFLAQRHGPSPAEPDPHYGNHHHLFAEHGYRRLKEVGGQAELFVSEKGIRGTKEAEAVEEAFLRKHLRLDDDNPAAPPSPPD